MELLELYRTEMNGRVAGVRAAIAALPPVGVLVDDPYVTFYEVYLHAHTVKGTSLQLQFAEAAAVGERMVELLRPAQEHGRLDQPARDRILTWCNTLADWLASPDLAVPPAAT